MERFSLPSTVGDVFLIFRTDKNHPLGKGSICLHLEVGMIGGGIAGSVVLFPGHLSCSIQI